MKRLVALALSSSSCSAARPAARAAPSSSSSAEWPATSTTVSNQVSITSIRHVRLWLAEDHIVACTSAEIKRIREAVAVLSCPKPKQQDLEPLRPKWEVSRMQGRKRRSMADIIQEFHSKIIKAAQKLASSPGSAERPAPGDAPSVSSGAERPGVSTTSSTQMNLTTLRGV